MTLDQYCNSSASDRFHGNPYEEEPEPDIDTEIDAKYEMNEAKE
jgi:hypothetical protein